MKTCIFNLFIAANLCYFASCDQGTESQEKIEVRKLIVQDFTIDRDFHYRLSSLLGEAQSNHRGVRSLLEKAGISFNQEGSLVALNTEELKLHFENTEEEHNKLKLLLGKIYGDPKK